MATITVDGDDGLRFSAAHSGLHGGQLEALHGHSYSVTLRLHGDPGEDGMICDFTIVRRALASLIVPLRRRTLMPAQIPGGYCRTENGQLLIGDGTRHYSLPAADVVLLPVSNTSTEALAGYLLGQIAPHLAGTPVRLAELTLTESADTCATVKIRPGSH